MNHRWVSMMMCNHEYLRSLLCAYWLTSSNSTDVLTIVSFQSAVIHGRICRSRRLPHHLQLPHLPKCHLLDSETPQFSLKTDYNCRSFQLFSATIRNCLVYADHIRKLSRWPDKGSVPIRPCLHAHVGQHLFPLKIGLIRILRHGQTDTTHVGFVAWRAE